MLKKILYNQANARFPTNQTINHTTGRRIHIIEFTLPLSDQVIHHIAVKVPKSNAATQIHTTNPMKIFPKKDQAVTSFGALSNIAISGFDIFFDFCGELISICGVQIGGMPPRFCVDCDIVQNKRLKVWTIWYF